MAFRDVFVDEVRRAADIVRVISDHVALKRVGASWKGLCPFHQEKTPSFHVRSEPPVFHCFGCGEGGDVFKFVMLYDKSSFPEAVEALARRFGVPVPETRYDTGPERQARERVLAAMEAAALHYARNFWSSAGRPAREYLLGRGFKKETLERLRVGAALEGWGDLGEALGPHFPGDVLLNAGLVLPGKDGRRPYDRFRNRAVFPILNEAGKVVAFGARSLDGSEPKYLNSPETPVYQKGRTLYGLNWAKDAIRREGRIVLMEGYLDVARAVEAGVGEAVATCGTALTPSHARLLRRFTERVALNFDQDEAGRTAARRGFDALAGEGLQIQVVELPEGHDPDTYLKEAGAGAYRSRLDEAPSFVEWAIGRAVARHETVTPPGQAAYAKELLPVLARVVSAVERSGWVRRAAEVGGLDAAALETELQRALQPPPVPPRPPATGGRRDEPLTAERFLLSMIACRTEGVDQALADLEEADIADRPWAALWRAAIGLARRGAGVEAAALASELGSDDLARVVTGMAVEPEPTGDSTPKNCVQTIKLRSLTARRAAEVNRAIDRAQAEGADVDPLLREKQELAHRIAHLDAAAMTNA